MNGTHESLVELVQGFNEASLHTETDIVIAPPSLYRADLAHSCRNLDGVG